MRRVETALTAVPGVQSARANLATHAVEVDYATPASPGTLTATLTDAGYPPREQTLRFDVEGLSCASCVRRLETALSDVPGVVSVRVNLGRRKCDRNGLSATPIRH